MTKKAQKKEIIWNIINSLLAAGLVMMGTLVDGNIDLKGILASLIAGGIVAITQFKRYWQSQESEYSNLFNFTMH